MPLGYEVFVGNRADVTTVEEIVETMEARYGRADRIWAMDRGMVSQDNIKFLKAGGRRYILGTPRGMLKRFERELLGADWQQVREELQVKLCPSADGQETFILCRSAQRREKEKAMHARFEQRIEQGLKQIEAGCQRRNYKPGVIERRVGKLLGRNTRAAGLFEVRIEAEEHGAALLKWSKVESWRRWAELSEGCYLLRTNVNDWSAQELWEAYIQLTEAEPAFRVHKSDPSVRPIWHQIEERVQAHILVCFLAYVLWKTLAQRCKVGGLGDEPRKVLEELKAIQMVDVVLPIKKGYGDPKALRVPANETPSHSAPTPGTQFAFKYQNDRNVVEKQGPRFNKIKDLRI